MKPGQYRLKPNPGLFQLLTEHLARQKAEILAGKITVKWSQARCGYCIRSGRSSVLGLKTFISEGAAWEWLKETHNIDQP